MTAQEIDVLLVDDDELFRAELLHVLAREELTTRACGSLAAARAALARQRPAVVLLDIQLPDGNGVDLLRELLAAQDPSEVIMVSGAATLQEAADSIKLGAGDFLEKPFEARRLLASVAQALRVARLKRANRKLVASRLAEYEIIGDSPPIRRLRAQIATIATTDARVLVTGESGTGKELVAGQLHYLSRRADGPFVKINCSALPEDLVESELFGHERGAFTGALRSRPGRFTQASGGTLLLDEIGDMPLTSQPKLLRAIETGEVEPVGAGTAVGVDVRLICSSHQDLAAMVQAGRFRDDLFYRIHAVPIAVPPLREHREDIPILVECFFERLGARDPSVARRMAPAAYDPLVRYEWPGNVRQLKNVVERLFYTTAREQIGREEVLACLGLPDEPGAVCAAHPPTADPARALEPEDRNLLTAAVHRFETAFLQAELERNGGNVSQLAVQLGMDRGNLYRKLKRLGLLSS